MNGKVFVSVRCGWVCEWEGKWDNFRVSELYSCVISLPQPLLMLFLSPINNTYRASRGDTSSSEMGVWGVGSAKALEHKDQLESTNRSCGGREVNCPYCTIFYVLCIMFAVLFGQMRVMFLFIQGLFKYDYILGVTIFRAKQKKSMCLSYSLPGDTFRAQLRIT